jgi:predicted DNA-binding transcriptional regulator YafY
LFGSSAEEVVLEFSPKVKRLVIERRWRKMVEREEHAAGGVRLVLKAAITPDLVAWIASFLDDCRIMTPLSLREDVARRQALASAGHAKGAEW